MKKLFYVYYLKWFVLFSAVFGLLFLVELFLKVTDLKEVEFFTQFGRILFFCTAGIILFTLSFGGYYHLWDELIWPRKRIAILRRKELRELERINFQLNKEAITYGGFYKNYYFVISPYLTANEGNSLIIFAFIALIEVNVPELENLDNQYRLTFTKTSVCIEKTIYSQGKDIPNLHQLMREMDKIIAYLRSKNIQPGQVEIAENTNR